MPAQLRRWQINRHDGTGVPTISIVKDPAHEQAFLKFNQQKYNISDEDIQGKDFNNIIQDFLVLEAMGSIKVGKVPDNVARYYTGKNVIFGAFMVPWKPIFRIDQETGEQYYGFFTPTDIFNAMQVLSRQPLTTRFNQDHDGTQFLDGAYLIESEFVVDQKRSKAAAFGQTVPIGTWWGGLSLDENTETFEKYNEGSGFSVEALLNESIFESFEVSSSK